MRRLLPLTLLALLLAGCADYMPVKDSFGVSGLRRAGKTPPEYALFNNYDPNAAALVANQICARPYVILQQKTHRASPGELLTSRGPCQPYVWTIYNWPTHVASLLPQVPWYAAVTVRPWPQTPEAAAPPPPAVAVPPPPPPPPPTTPAPRPWQTPPPVPLLPRRG